MRGRSRSVGSSSGEGAAVSRETGAESYAGLPTFHVKPERSSALVRGAAHRLGLSLGSSQVQGLIAYEALLAERAVPLGLVSRSDADRLMSRHILDCLRAAPLVRPEDRLVIDLGSGAGLPGIVLAIAVPGVHLRLIEPRRRRVAFLEMAIEHLALSNATVLPGRAEETRTSADLATARALAPLGRSWALTRPLLRPQGRLLYFSGPLDAPPLPPAGASEVALAGEKLVDSPGPIVIISRE